MSADPIEALTEILQQHIGCYSDDRPRERCVVHGTDWPCEALSNLVDEVQSWAETYPPEDVLDSAATRPPDDCPHGRNCEPWLYLVCLTHKGETA